MAKTSQTPLMQQYYAVKEKHPDAILLFRVGDFYELYDADAERSAEILGITLTKRSNGAASQVSLAGFPYHALDAYLPKLVRSGHRVAICEQLEDPKLAKSIVKRGVTELVTPGTALGDNILEGRENNFLASVHIDPAGCGAAFLDISTGEFLVAEGPAEHVDKLLQSFNPKEVLYQRERKADFAERFGSRFFTFAMDDWAFELTTARDKLARQFETKSLKGFGVDHLPLALVAAGAALHYLELTHHRNLDNIKSIARIDQESHVWLDKFTIRNLEIFSALHEHGRSLVETLDNTLTPMGCRTLKRWFALPLKQVAAIRERQDAVAWLLAHPDGLEQAQQLVKQVGDLERLVSKVAVQRVTPRELAQLAESLRVLAPLKRLCAESGEAVLERVAEQINPCEGLCQRVERELRPSPPPTAAKGGVIADGVCPELDDLRQAHASGRDFLARLQGRYSMATRIPSLKISYNNVFGYYIEVRNSHRDKVPDDWIRKQTLVNAERYVTPELKEHEAKILGAEERILEIEQRLYADLVVSLADYVAPIQLDAALVARVDCLQSFAAVAAANGYCRPVVDDSLELSITAGRHPVIETLMGPGEEYVPNDIELDPERQQIVIVTGPNMAGKSALLRQTALIALMAQVGCYVPARAARMGVVDKIFTRVGASDNISLGESTFMVEMNEAASILNNLSERSLVLFDELGRGTSTYDGISIAWAIVEHLHDNGRCRPKTLFATHYHELNEMEANFARVKNYNVAVREVDNRVVFIRKLARGGSEHSFGIHVARMAGMPAAVVSRAEKVLRELEDAAAGKGLAKPVKNLGAKREGYQLSFFQLDDPTLAQVRDEIKGLDIDNLTPLEALNKLAGIRRILGLK